MTGRPFGRPFSFLRHVEVPVFPRLSVMIVLMAEQPKLLDRTRNAIRSRHYSPRTEEAYVMWIKRYIFFHGKRHPGSMGAEQVNAFLSSLAVDGRRCSA